VISFLPQIVIESMIRCGSFFALFPRGKVSQERLPHCQLCFIGRLPNTGGLRCGRSPLGGFFGSERTAPARAGAEAFWGLVLLGGDSTD